jgi:hypothetical protein
MSKGEALYLAMVIAGMLSFVATLAWESRRPRSRTGRARHAGALPPTGAQHNPAPSH